MAAPFSAVFVDRGESEWASDLMKQMLGILGVTDVEDKRF